MTTIRKDLREIIAKYGLSEVYHELQAEMRETFEFLRHVYEPPKNNLVIPLATIIPDHIATPLHKPIGMTVGSIDPPSLELSTKTEDTPSPKESSDGSNQDQTLKEVIIQAKREVSQEGSEKFSKAKHREEVAKKHKENLEKGVRPESLLTKDNLSQWLGQGMSYMRIARELVGVPENEIAAIAKTFGLQSDVKKYIVMKRSGK